MAAPTTVVSVLGESRPVTYTWESGEWQCPFCTTPNPVAEGGCRNPWCDANPHMPVERARERQSAKQARETEEERRRQTVEWSRGYREERARELAEHIARSTEQARERGACTDRRCLFPKYKGQIVQEQPRFVRHRKACPNG